MQTVTLFTPPKSNSKIELVESLHLLTITHPLCTFEFQRSRSQPIHLCAWRTALIFCPRAHSRCFQPPALTSSGEGSWSSPAFGPRFAPGSQHPQSSWVVSSRSKPPQTPAASEPAACDQQLIRQAGSLPRAKQHSFISTERSLRGFRH